MHVNEVLSLDEHMKVLEKIHEDFWKFSFDNETNRNDFCKRVMKAIVSGKYRITFIFMLESSDTENQINMDMLKKIGANYEKLGIEHTIHGFITPQATYDELKNINKG